MIQISQNFNPESMVDVLCVLYLSVRFVSVYICVCVCVCVFVAREYGG